MRVAALFLALALLAGVAAVGLNAAPVCGASSGQLVLKFPAVKDFGGVQGRVLYVRVGLPEWMPLRCASDRVEAACGFFPAGRHVTALYAGARIGSAVVPDGDLVVPVSQLPAGSALAVVESEQPLPQGPGWVFRGRPKWAGDKDAVLFSHFAGVTPGGDLATLIHDPYQYSWWYAVAVYDGVTWHRSPDVYLRDTYGVDFCVADTGFWVAGVDNFTSVIVCRLPEITGSWEHISTGGFDYFSKDLLAVGGEVYMNNPEIYDWCNFLYRYDRGAGGWVKVARPISRYGPYAVRGSRLVSFDGAVNELVGDSWVRIDTLPASARSGALAPDGTLWVVDTSGYTWRKTPGTSSWENLGKILGLESRAVAPMPDGSTWGVASGPAVAYLRDGVWVDAGFPLAGTGAAVSLHAGRAGSLYAMTDRGLYELPCALAP